MTQKRRANACVVTRRATLAFVGGSALLLLAVLAVHAQTPFPSGFVDAATVVDGLVVGALGALSASGVLEGAVEVVSVPGAFELPAAAMAAARSGRFDAVVALGAVIRGETDHYEHISREAAAGLSRVALDTGVPVGFGVLTCETEAQALARSTEGAAGRSRESPSVIRRTAARPLAP